MDFFQAINLDLIAIQKMDWIVNNYFLNCSNKMLVCVFLTINLIVFQTKEPFAIIQTVRMFAKF